MSLNDSRGLAVSSRSTTARERAHLAAAPAWMLRRFDQAVKLYGDIAIEHPRDLVAIQSALELVNASQLLSRISLRNFNVGARWKELSDCWARPAEGGYYALNDVHALMAYASAGREDLARRIVAMLERRAEDPDTNGHNTREVGLPLARCHRGDGSGQACGSGGLAAARPQQGEPYWRQPCAARPRPIVMYRSDTSQR